MAIYLDLGCGQRLVLGATAEVNPKQCAGMNHLDCSQDCIQIGGDQGFVVVAQDDERYWGVPSILLVSNTLIGSDNGLEAGILSGFEQCPITKACPSLVSGSADVMAGKQPLTKDGQALVMGHCPSLVSGSSDVMAGKQPPELVGEIFIEEDAHGSRWLEVVLPRRRDRPSVRGSPRPLRSARAPLTDSPRRVGPGSGASGS